MKWIAGLALVGWTLAALILTMAGGSTSLARTQAKGPQADLPRLKLWDRVMRERWEKTDRLLQQADALLSQKQYPKATTLLQQAIATRPYAPSLWFALGTVHSYSERYPDCVQALTKCRRLDPKFRPNLLSFRLGLCLSLSGRIAAGIGEYRKVTGSGEVGAEVLQWNLGDNHMALGRLEEAVTHYQEALRLSPGRPVLHFALAVALDRQGQWEAATRRMRYGLQLDPLGRSLDSGEILWLPPHEHLYYRALVHMVRGERAQAIGSLQKFERAAPRNPWRFVMRLRAEGLRARALGPEDVQARRGALDPEKVATALAGRQDGLRRCLGSLPETWTLPHLKGVSIAVTLQAGRPAGAKIDSMGWELGPTARACLERELGQVRWTGALKTRETASFSVEVVGP